MLAVEHQEYQYWTKQASRIIPIQTGAFEEYDNWHNRALLGRLLANMNFYEPAIDLLSSILEDAEKEDQEHYIWALSDLANYFWVAQEDREEAFKLINKAIDAMVKSTKNTFPLINKGFLYNQRWQILALSGDSTQAIEEINIMIEQELSLDNDNNRNSLLFYAYFNLALFAFEKGEIEKATQLLKLSYSYSEIRSTDIEDIMQLGLSPQGTVTQLLSLTHRNLQFDL